jgi:type IV secretory pathway VirB10-like protein
MRPEFEKQPYRGHLDGGVVGEFVAPAGPLPQPQPLRQFVIPPPYWDKEERERPERERAADEAKAQRVLADKAKREEAQE